MISFRSIIDAAPLCLLGMMGVVVLGMDSLSASPIVSEKNEATLQETLGMGIPLRERLSFADNAIKGLTESLIEAHVQQDSLSHQIEEINDRIHLYGLNLSNKTSISAENKLLSLMKDLRSFKEENNQLRQQLLALSEAAITSKSATISNNTTAVPTASGQKTSQISLEDNLTKELNATTALLKNRMKKSSAPQAADLTSGKILEVKPELSLVVTNLGARHGVNIGMPFQVWRNDHRVGTIKVVDVRSAISGAIVQNSTKMHDFLRAGDQLHIDLIH